MCRCLGFHINFRGLWASVLLTLGKFPAHLVHSYLKKYWLFFCFQSMYNSGDCYRRRDLFTIHSIAGSHERVQSTRAQCTKRCLKITVLLVWVHRRNGKGLHICCVPITRRCFDGQVIFSHVTYNCFFNVYTCYVAIKTVSLLRLKGNGREIGNLFHAYFIKSFEFKTRCLIMEMDEIGNWRPTLRW